MKKAQAHNFVLQYEGDYEGCASGYTRAGYYATPEGAANAFKSACLKALRGEISSDHFQIRRCSDQRIVADCRVWRDPVTFEEFLDEMNDQASKADKVPHIRRRLAAIEAELKLLLDSI